MEFFYYWADLIVVLFVLLLLLLGFRKGLLAMVYRFASFFVSLVIAWLLYPRAADLLSAFGLEQWIADLVRANYVEPSLEQTTADISDLPAYLQSMVQSGQIGLTDAATAQVTHLIMNIAAFVLVLILVRLVVWVIGQLLHVVSKLPVIGCLNRIGGAALGAAEGILLVYIVLALLFAAAPLRSSQQVEQYIEQSVLTKAMYENNPLVQLVSPTNYDAYL